MEIKKEIKKGNIRYVSVRIPEAQSTTVMIMVKTGSRFETKNQSGLAHFVEHMMFKGTSQRPTSKQIGMAIETIGGSSNAFTSYDYTGYYIKVPKENTLKALPILTDMLTDGLFEQSEIDKERGVITEEIRMYEDRPSSKVRSIWSEKFFGDSPLGRDIAGSIENVSDFKRKDFLDFIGKYYGGENLLVVVAGDFDQNAVGSHIQDAFSNLNDSPDTDFVKYKKEAIDSNVINLHKPIEQSHLVLGGYSHNRTFKDKYVFKVFDSILGMGFGSRLFQVIRDELGLAYYVYTNQSSSDDIGIYQVGLGVENSKIEKAVEAVMLQMKEVMTGNFDDDELVRAKNYLIGNLITDFESTDSISLWYGLQELNLGKFYDPSEIKAFIEKVTQDDIVRVAQEVLGGGNFLLAGVTPHETIDTGISSVLTL